MRMKMNNGEHKGRRREKAMGFGEQWRSVSCDRKECTHPKVRAINPPGDFNQKVPGYLMTYRNINCRFYSDCLTLAARANTKEMHCRHCMLEDDNSCEMNWEDLAGLMRLYQYILGNKGILEGV